jgi:hypothetical protein
MEQVMELLRAMQNKTDFSKMKMKAQLDSNQETKGSKEIIAETNVWREGIKACQKPREAEIITGLKVEAMGLETSSEVYAITKHQKVPNNEAAVETIRVLEDLCRDWCLTRSFCRKLTQVDDEVQQKLDATNGRLACHAVPALYKVSGKTPRHGIRRRSRRLELCLRNKETLCDDPIQTFGLEAVK